MQADFHYYATYCAAILAGYSHAESMDICYCAQLPDVCTKTFLKELKAPVAAATTQLQVELLDTRTDIISLQDITRIWASFHFLPKDLHAEPEKGGRRYRSKYRLICGPDGELVKKTVEIAKGKDLQAAGLAMHVLADTWAHMYFAGVPSLVINNTNYGFYEFPGNGPEQRKITFIHNPGAKDDLEKSIYVNSLFRSDENSIMNLGHGRAGHLPDYSFIRYKYLPAWGGYREFIKDNPADYRKAFGQMILALRYLRGESGGFETGEYEPEIPAEYLEEADRIIRIRRTDASEDWKAFGQRLSGNIIEAFDLKKYREEYLTAADKDSTFLGRFITAVMAQKSMVTKSIFESGNLLAGFAVDEKGRKFRFGR